MKVIILAGGFGTRLRSVVSDVPKPLAPVAGKTFIAHLIAHWMEQGVKEFVFLLHYEACQIQAVLKEMSCDPKFSGVNFKTITEDTHLGPVALSYMPSKNLVLRIVFWSQMLILGWGRE